MVLLQTHILEILSNPCIFLHGRDVCQVEQGIFSFCDFSGDNSTDKHTVSLETFATTTVTLPTIKDGMLTSSHHVLMTSVDCAYTSTCDTLQARSPYNSGCSLQLTVPGIGDQQSDMLALQQTYQEQLEIGKGNVEKGLGKPIVKLYRTLR